MAKDKGFDWKTYDGLDVPESAVSPFDKKKEPKMRKMLKLAEAANAANAAFQKYVREQGDALQKERCANKGMEFSELEPYTLKCYDQTVKLVVSKTKKVEVTDDVKAAMKLINEFVESTLADEKFKKFRKLVMRALVPTRGKLSAVRLNDLKAVEMDDPRWIEAMDVLNAAIQNTFTVRNFKVYKSDIDGKFKAVW